ncbi:hypothetical protein Tco_1061511, partial [Tanacetum coccineum]
LAEFMLFHLSATNSTRPPSAIDEVAEREEEDDAFFLARSRPISHSSQISSLELPTSSIKLKPPCVDAEVVSEVFLGFFATLFSVKIRHLNFFPSSMILQDIPTRLQCKRMAVLRFVFR